MKATHIPKSRIPKGKAAPLPDEARTVEGLFQNGLYAETVAFASQLTTRYPKHPLAWGALGVSLHQLGRSGEALAALEKAIQLAPDDVAAICNLAHTLEALGQSARAEAAYRKAIHTDRNFLHGHRNLGDFLYRQSRLREAEASYRTAIRLDPRFTDGHFNLGVTLKDQGRHSEAIASFQAATDCEPGFVEAYSNLGAIFRQIGRPADAEPHLRKALEINPNAADCHYNLGIVLRDLGRFEASEKSARRCVELDPAHVAGLTSLGTTLEGLGRTGEAEACYRSALQIDPACADAQSHLLFAMNYRESAASAIIEEAERYGRLIAVGPDARHSSWNCADQDGPLRIGMVSGDFRDHPVGHFLEGVLAHLDPRAVALYGYPTNERSDPLTARIRPFFAGWRSLKSLDDAAAAEAIHKDGVHVLLDLSGHTSFHRLPVFARKPAPVQASWLGYFATTGLCEMDYFIADPHSVPPGGDERFTETIWRLPETRLCFTAPEFDITVSPLPAMERGFVTFGCFNNLSKINDAVVALWARVLTAVPVSRLYLLAPQLGDPAIATSTLSRFAAHGIAAGRLTLEGAVPRAQYLAAYRSVDIALDPFPYNGGTTTAEALWMGVPVLTLKGEQVVSRQGLAILSNAGLTDWVASNMDDYALRALRHAADPGALAELRASLRQRVLASPMFDAPRFARHFERAMLQMWAERKTARP